MTSVVRGVKLNHDQLATQKRKAENETTSPPRKRRKENNPMTVAIPSTSEYVVISEAENSVLPHENELKVNRPGISLKSRKAKYKLQDFLGKGCFGEVMKCLNKKTKEVAAMKITEKTDFDQEAIIWKQLIKLNREHVPIVKVLDLFQQDSKGFMVFELLDQSLKEFTKHQCVPIEGVRRISKDLLTALSKLKEIGIIHTDIKLDNIMLVDHARKPYSVKLIDFGLAIDKKRGYLPDKVQSLRYRAPEVLLGLPYDEAIDMWSVGCIVGTLLIGSRLFSAQCEYEVMRFIHEIRGMPPLRMLNRNKNAFNFFTRIRRKFSTGLCQYKWRLLTPEQYYSSIGQKFQKIPKKTVRRLQDTVEINFNATVKDGVSTTGDSNLRKLCTDLLKKMLIVDPENRIAANDAVKHLFFRQSIC